MSFCIEYNPEQNRRYPLRNGKKGRGKVFITITAVSIGFLLLGKSLITKTDGEGMQLIKVTGFDQMVEDIREGSSVSEALTTFCLDILKNAEID